MSLEICDKCHTEVSFESSKYGCPCCENIKDLRDEISETKIKELEKEIENKDVEIEKMDEKISLIEMCYPQACI